jgi:hypothetical protein
VQSSGFVTILFKAVPEPVNKVVNVFGALKHIQALFSAGVVPQSCSVLSLADFGSPQSLYVI